VVATGAPSVIRLQAGPAGRLLIGIFTRLLLKAIGEDVERPLALVFIKGGSRARMSFWLHAKGEYSSYAIESLQQIGYDSGLAGGMGLIFLASLSLCSRCCCWSWLSVRPSFSAWTRSSAQSTGGDFSGSSSLSSAIRSIVRLFALGAFVNGRFTASNRGRATPWSLAWF
jgi:hypothetical protein